MLYRFIFLVFIQSFMFVCVQAYGSTSYDSLAYDCLNNLRSNSIENGVSYDDFDRFTKDVKLLNYTITSSNSQKSLQENWGVYISKMINKRRLNKGIEILKDFRVQLDEIGNKYKVDPELLVAILGIETNYGENMGSTDVLNAWFTRACTESNVLWKKNFYASIKILRDGIVEKNNFIGSWSGAFGMTQFIPTSFYELAVDGDGDGVIDLYNSFLDATASTANHLKKRNFSWQYNIPAVIEVLLPEELLVNVPSDIYADFLDSSNKHTLKYWYENGVTRANNKNFFLNLTNDLETSIFAPSGCTGPIFLVSDNFYSIVNYNRSRRYALAVSLLCNFFKGEEAILYKSWPN
ncbi:membrane-bound lytic murein transglycosylase B [Candidatus Kinetoplastibacterium desouzaii TCC079E]|uniref:Membrane-bound lytic murein transglycosylase B n=1 Tax=Candidatus Kinetoplastidibacterium desouzai TCC079E TaxID=1208919 RepID=M1LM02_9PROT|nr:lytic murein transglycosylase [Candidatus Kinetoplastibacterium desouzaii]AGF46742.1 membrane-bound lytic murein transglycosylase B [Candidatus Kinetoplastibacterium desouzaii TCC079E]